MNEREIFTAASQIDEAKLRHTFLDAVCQGDLLLRYRIDKLLEAQAASGDVVERPARLFEKLAGEIAEPGKTEVDSDVPPPPINLIQGQIKPGTLIGPYQIQQLLGEGGMGVVYVAKQSVPVKRQVALKILRPGDNSRNILARFEQERHALAMMDHPGIAKILDAGTTDDGRPYFVMELVKGIPISDYCDRENLSPKERLQLFIPVCAAVQHAHQKGIIHRDLKPSNILIALYDGQPIPKVIDFGVAKAVGFRLSEDTVYTEVGSIVGTIEYMAPEQAELNNLDIDTRADVYALGVILYELLTGGPPFTRQELRSAAFDEMLRMIREVEPQKPSTKISSSGELASIAAHRKLEPRQLTRLLSGDLDWVVMKALAKERNRRYQSVGDLSADIGRFLNFEAVEAGPPSIRYKFRKFVLRNRTTVGAVTLALTTLIVAIVATSYALSIALRERDEKSIALESERKARQEVSEANDRTLAALRSLTDEVVTAQFAGQTELSPSDRRFLEEIGQRFADFSDVHVSTKSSRAIRADGLVRHALITKILGDSEKARQEYQEALSIWEKQTAEFPREVVWQFESARTQLDLGRLELDEDNLIRAEQLVSAALRTMLTIRDKMIDQPDFVVTLSETHHTLGVVNYELERPDEAIRQVSSAFALCQLDVTNNPDDQSRQIRLAKILNSWANQLKVIGELNQAIEKYKTAIDIVESIRQQSPEWSIVGFDLGLFHKNIGGLFRQLHEFEQAEYHLDRSIEVLEILVDNFPVISKYSNSLASCYGSRASVDFDQKKWESALAFNERGLKIGEQLVRRFPDSAIFQSEVAELHLRKGLSFVKLNRSPDALESYRLAAEILTKIVRERPEVIDYQQQLAMTENALGLFFMNQGESDEAIQHLNIALAIREKLFSDHPELNEYSIDLAGSQCNLGNYLYDIGRTEDSIPCYQRAESILTKLLEKNPQLGLARKYLRNVYAGRLRVDSRMERHAEAVEFADKAIALDDGTQELVYTQMKLKCQANIQPDKAVEGGERLLQRHPDDSSVLFQVACVCSIAAEKTDLEEKENQFALRAIELLNRCRDLGEFSTSKGKARLREAPELNALRQRPEFDSLLIELKPADTGDSSKSDPLPN